MKTETFIKIRIQGGPIDNYLDSEIFKKQLVEAIEMGKLSIEYCNTLNYGSKKKDAPIEKLIISVDCTLKPPFPCNQE